VTEKAHLNGSEKTESAAKPEKLPRGAKTTNYVAVSATWVETAEGARETRYHMVKIDSATHRTRSVLLGVADDACDHEVCGMIMAMDLYYEYASGDATRVVGSSGRHAAPAVQTTIE
jgi:hypothetical protein